MSSIFEMDDQHFEVVVNDQKQYSVWPKEWPVPTGWNAVGISGLRPDCLRHIEAIWTDMRPHSLAARRADKQPHVASGRS
jgi:MbtH protein